MGPTIASRGFSYAASARTILMSRLPKETAMVQRSTLFALRTALFVAVAMISGCSDDGEDTNDGTEQDGTDTIGDSGVDTDGETATEPIRLFTSAIQRIVVEVDYAGIDAAPYIDSLTKNYWDIFQVNADKLFEVSEPTIEIPDELSEMEDIGAVSNRTYPTFVIQALAGEFRDTLSSDTVASFYILFLDGLYEVDGVAQDNVIGVSIGDTGVIAIFKPVIEKIGATDDSRAMGEQATLVHEFGHAVGLVNNPVPPQADHHDSEHGAHCTNEDCVMYYLNERPNELTSFVGGLLGIGADTILFDEQCLNDIRAVSSE